MMHVCHTQNGSGYETFFRIQTAPKQFGPFLLRVPRTLSQVVVGGRGAPVPCRREGTHSWTSPIHAVEKHASEQLRRRQVMRGLQHGATPQFSTSASLRTALHCKQISFLSVLTFTISKHFSTLPNPTTFSCDFRNLDELPTTEFSVVYFCDFKEMAVNAA